MKGLKIQRGQVTGQGGAKRPLRKNPNFLDSVYGFPKELLEGVVNYDLHPIEE